MGTLYTPPRKPPVSRRTLRLLLVLLVAVGLGATLSTQQAGCLGRGAASVLGWFGHPTITVDVATIPTRADVLLDGERVTELPLQVRRDETLHHVAAIAPGYEPAEVTFKADENKHIILTLRPAKRR